MASGDLALLCTGAGVKVPTGNKGLLCLILSFVPMFSFWDSEGSLLLKARSGSHTWAIYVSINIHLCAVLI